MYWKDNPTLAPSTLYILYLNLKITVSEAQGRALFLGAGGFSMVVVTQWTSLGQENNDTENSVPSGWLECFSPITWKTQERRTWLWYHGLGLTLCSCRLWGDWSHGLSHLVFPNTGQVVMALSFQRTSPPLCQLSGAGEIAFEELGGITRHIMLFVLPSWTDHKFAELELLDRNVWVTYRISVCYGCVCVWGGERVTVF